MEQLKSPIKLICWSCGLESDYERGIDLDIPNKVKTIMSKCPECCGGDFGEEFWLDVCGREVSQNPDDN